MKTYSRLIALILTAIATLFVPQAQAGKYFDPADLIGCGSITSIRNTNQFPLLNQDFAIYAEIAQVNSSELAGFAVSNNLLGMGAAVISSVLFDAAANSMREAPVPLVPVDGKLLGHTLHAVRISLDDGREINLPLIESRATYFFGLPTSGRPFEIGRRVYLSHSTELNNIQVSLPRFSTPPTKEDADYTKECGLRIAPERANAIVKASEHLVNEWLIIE